MTVKPVAKGNTAAEGGTPCVPTLRMVFDKIKSWLGRRQETTPQSYAQQVGRIWADDLYAKYSTEHKNNPDVDIRDLRAVTDKIAAVVAALGDERVRLLVDSAQASNTRAINASLSIGRHAGDFLMIHDLDTASDDNAAFPPHVGPLQLLRHGESMRDVGIVELARRIPQHILPSTSLTFDCVSDNLKLALHIPGVSPLPEVGPRTS